MTNPTPSPLDLEALEAFMVEVTKERPNMADLETAGLAWLAEIRRLRSPSPGPAPTSEVREAVAKAVSAVLTEEGIGRRYCDTCEGMDHECGCNPSVLQLLFDRIGNHITTRVMAALASTPGTPQGPQTDEKAIAGHHPACHGQFVGNKGCDCGFSKRQASQPQPKGEAT